MEGWRESPCGHGGAPVPEEAGYRTAMKRKLELALLLLRWGEGSAAPSTFASASSGLAWLPFVARPPFRAAAGCRAVGGGAGDRAPGCPWERRRAGRLVLRLSSSGWAQSVATRPDTRRVSTRRVNL